MVKPWIKQGEMRVLAESYGKALVSQKFINHVGELVEWSFFYGRSRGCSIFMPVTADNQVIVIEQYRGGSDQIQLELPGGNFEEGENALSAAKRELEEETGYIPNKMVLLREKPIIIDPASYFKGGYHAVLALGCEKVKNRERRTDTHENIEVKLIPLEEWIKLTLNGLIDDQKSVTVTHIALPHLGFRI